MAKTIAQLRTEAQTIRDAVSIGENTAARVGGTIEDVVDYLDTEVGGGTFSTGEEIGDVSIFNDSADLTGKTDAQKELMLPNGKVVEELMSQGSSDAAIVDSIAVVLADNNSVGVTLDNGYIKASTSVWTAHASMRTWKITNSNYIKLIAHVRNTDTGAFAISFFNSSTISAATKISGTAHSGNAWDDFSVDVPDGTQLICVTTRDTYLADSYFKLTGLQSGVVEENKEKASASYNEIFKVGNQDEIDNDNAVSASYQVVTVNGNKRGIYFVDLSNYEDFKVSANAHLSSTYNYAFALSNTQEWNGTLYDSGWKNGEFAIDKSTAPTAIWLQIRCKKTGDTEVSFNEFLANIDFDFIGWNPMKGIKERVEDLEQRVDDLEYTDDVVTIQPIIDLSTPLAAQYYYGQKILPSCVDNSYEFVKVGQFPSFANWEQGGAIFGKYYFQFHTTMNPCTVFDLETKTNVQTINVTAMSNMHAGSGGFSTQYYDVSDPFPLLYVGSMEQRKIYVFRITGTEGAWSMSVVQTITLVTEYYLPNIAIDQILGKIVIFGYTKNSWSSPTGNEVVIFTCDIPNISGDVSIEAFENITKMPFVYALQGAYALYGKLYVSYGDSGSQYGSGIIVYDYLNRKIENFVGLNAISGEPESIVPYNHKIYMTRAGGEIFEIDFGL